MHFQTGIDETKYQLTRRTDEDDPSKIRHYPPGSFFPLIRGDALAVMGLRSYANNCLTVIEWTLNPITGEPLLENQILHLRALCEGAMDLADKWAQEPGVHLPD